MGMYIFRHCVQLNTCTYIHTYIHTWDAAWEHQMSVVQCYNTHIPTSIHVCTSTQTNMRCTSITTT